MTNPLLYFLPLALFFTGGCTENIAELEPPTAIPEVTLERFCQVATMQAQPYGAVAVQRNAAGQVMGVNFERASQLSNTFTYTNGLVTAINSGAGSYAIEYFGQRPIRVQYTVGANTIEARQEYDAEGRVEKERLTGIGPAYQDKIARLGLRVGDIVRADFTERYHSANNSITQPMPGAYFYDWRFDARWEGVNQTAPSTIGPHHQIAYRLTQTYPDQEHYILPRAFGGASLFFQANGFHFEPDGNSAYPLLVGAINDAVQALQAQGKQVSTISMVWVHGERDAGTKTNVDGYAQKFNELVAAISNDTGLPFRTIILQEVHDKLNPRSKPYIADLVAQMRTVAQQSDAYYSYNANNSEMSEDNIHFTANGYIQNGNLAFNLLTSTYATFSTAPEAELPKTVFYRYDGAGNLVKRIVRSNSGADVTWYYTYDQQQAPSYVGLHALPELPLHNMAYFTAVTPINTNNVVQVHKIVGTSGNFEEVHTYSYTYNSQGYPIDVVQQPAASPNNNDLEMTYRCID